MHVTNDLVRLGGGCTALRWPARVETRSALALRGNPRIEDYFRSASLETR
jgi:hypothetical protein